MGYKTVTKQVLKDVTENIPVCDLCKRELTNGVDSGCPSTNVMMRVFIGYVGGAHSIDYSTWGSGPRMFGLDLGDICIACREEWFKDLKKTFPGAREVKMND